MMPELPFIVFEATSACNLSCRYCYNYWKASDFEDINLNSYNKAKKTLKRLFKLVNVNHVTFTGGEPFLAERFSELVLYTRMKKKGVSIISNGNYARDTDYETMIKLGVSMFEFPVHSAGPEEHDFMTATEGSWKKSIHTVKSVLDYGGTVVCVVVLTKANFRDIGKTLEFIKSLGVNQIMINRFNIGGKGISEKENLVLSKEELNEAFAIADETGKKNNLLLSSNVCTPWCLVNHNKYSGIGFTSCSSSLYNKPITLNIDGDMRICNHSPRIIGNIFNDNINEIIDSEYVHSWGSIIPDLCSDCDLWTKCYGGCRAASEQLGYSIKTVDPAIG